MPDLGMIRPVAVPHLPQGRVRHLIIGKKYEKMLKNAAFRHDFELICIENNPYVDHRLAGHTDLMAAHLGENSIIMCDFLKDSPAATELTELGLSISYAPNCVSAQYPYDAALNFCLIGHTLLANSKTANADIVNKFTKESSLIDCKQGYTKCSVCVADERSIITQDRGIAKAADGAGLDVLLVENAGIKLDGFSEGFIGGASFKIAPDVLAFTGYIINNNVREQIESFLMERGIKAVYLNDCPAFDIGSAIPITEEIEQ